MPPSTHFGLKDQETRYRQRYLDLIVNPDVQVGAAGLPRKPWQRQQERSMEPGVGRRVPRFAQAVAPSLAAACRSCLPTQQDIFRTRTKIIAGVRRFLDDRGFLEVCGMFFPSFCYGFGVCGRVRFWMGGARWAPVDRPACSCHGKPACSRLGCGPCLTPAVPTWSAIHKWRRPLCP